MAHVRKPVLSTLLTLLLCVAAGALLLFQLSKARTFQLFGGLTYRVQTDRKVVALTFDDAPNQHSDSVLLTLAEKHVPATFYVIGESIQKYPMGAQKIARAGHELGNHSYTHQRMVLKSLSFIDREIQETNKLIRASGYDKPITFRPPYSKKLFMLPFYLKRNNIRTVMFDVEPETYAPAKEGKEKTTFLETYTLDRVRPGSIILLHPFCDSCGSTRDAIPKIIDMLRAKGYEFVTVSTLLGMAK